MFFFERSRKIIGHEIFISFIILIKIAFIKLIIYSRDKIDKKNMDISKITKVISLSFIKCEFF